MSRRAVRICLVLALLGSFRCGKKGPILPPLVRVPQPVEAVSLSRVGNRVILVWKNPTAYVDGSPLRGGPEVEVWVIEEAAPEGGAAVTPNKADFDKKGRLMEKILGEGPVPKGEGRPAAPGSIILEPDPGTLAVRSLFFSIRVRDEKRRPSEFSDPVVLAPGPALPPPRGLRASMLEKSIDLAWDPPSGLADKLSSQIAGYNVYRSEAEMAPVRLNAAPVAGLGFRDEIFYFGKVYEYFVRSAAAAAPGAFESDNSEAIKVEPVDKFPPAAPQGLTVIAGEGFIALSWEPSDESDLAGYRVWRRRPEQADLALLKELPPAENSFSDSQVEIDTQYVYAITAFDRAGNESAKSAPATGLARRRGD